MPPIGCNSECGDGEAAPQELSQELAECDESLFSLPA